MPRAPHLCGKQGCTKLVPHQAQCPDHPTTHRWGNTGKGRNVPYALQQACFKRDHHTCQRCGFKGQPGKAQLHADHKHNRARGGQDTLNNLETLCVPCHQAKTKRELRPTAR